MKKLDVDNSGTIEENEWNFTGRPIEEVLKKADGTVLLHVTRPFVEVSTN